MSRASAYRLLCAIGAWDPTGGAGLVADVETFAAHGARACGVVTALTTQGPAGVAGVTRRPAREVRAELLALARTEAPAAFKVGVVASAPVARVLAALRARLGPGPWVVDPVLEAGAGGRLLPRRAQPGLEVLLRRADVVTPNVPEALALLGRPRRPRGLDPLALARHLHRRLGGPAVLLKGGHQPGRAIVDVLVGPGLERRWSHPRQAGPTLHGTGCTLASALLARLAEGQPLDAAAEGAIGYVQEAIATTHAQGHWCLRRPPAAP